MRNLGYTGSTTIAAGTLTLGGGSALDDDGSVTLGNATGATLVINRTETIGTLAGGGSAGGNITLAAGQTLTITQATDTNYAGAISGTGNFTKAGASTLTLSGNNTYTGNTTIAAGTLTLTGGSAIADTGAVVLANAALATLNLNASETIGNLSGGGILGGNITLDSNTLTVNQTSATTYAGAISGTGNLTKIGGSALTLSGNNTYTGTLTLSGGSAIADNGAVVLANANTATLNLNASETIGTLSGGGSSGGNITLGSSTLTVNQTTNTIFSGRISGTAGLTKTGAGTLTLNGSNTYSGTTTINAGTLTLSGGSAIADTGAFSLANASGATLSINSSETIGTLSGGGSSGGNITLGSNTLTVNQTTNTIFSGRISGNGSLTKTGAGTLTLNGSNTYSGATMVSRGTLIIQGDQSGATGLMTVASGAELWYSGNATMNGPVAISGTLANVGSIESLSVGSASFTSTGVFSSELGLSGLAAVNDQLNVTTAVGVSLESGADLRLTLGAGLTKANIGDMFFLIANQHTDASITGVFTSLNGVAMSLNEGSTFTWNSQQWEITYQANAEGLTPSFTGGNDLAIIQIVPEPGTWALFGLAGIFLLMRRRKASAPHQG